MIAPSARAPVYCRIDRMNRAIQPPTKTKIDNATDAYPTPTPIAAKSMC